MKTYSRNQLAAWKFDDQASVKVGSKVIVRGQVDGKRAYHVETRGIAGNLVESQTYLTMSALKAAL